MNERMDVHRATGWAGVAGVGLFLAGNVLWGFEQPAPDASGATLVDFYATASDRIVVGALLSLSAIAVFAAFACGLRHVLRDRGAGEVLADAALAGALLGLAPGLGAETVNMMAAMRAGDGALTEPLALALFDVSYALGSYALGPGFGLFALAVSAAAWHDPALLRRPFAIGGLVIAAALITPLAALTIGEYTIVLAFVLALSVAIRLLSARAAGP